SYRWADRATVSAPDFGAAHLDCVRRLRQVGRPGQAFAEAQYRCREILDRAQSGKLAANDWQAPHHAALLIAFAHLDVGRIGEAKARLAAARALVLAGDLDEALDQIQIVQLRRSQSRLEGEINRVLRLAATRSAGEWDKIVERRLERGAFRLARMAARDLCDFVPGTDSPVMKRALGDRKRLAVEARWIADLAIALPAADAHAIAQRPAAPGRD